MNLSTTAYPSGYDPDTWGALSTAEESDEKWLGKIDWQINDMHRLTVKYSQTEATEPQYGEYSDSGETALTSHFYTNDFKNTAYSAELNSTWNDNFQTQIQLGGDTFDKKPTYTNQNLIPQMWIDDFPGADGGTGEVFFGSEDSRQANELAVETKKAKAVGIYSLEDHTVTFGIETEETEFDNLFLQDVYGDIEFNNLAEFLDPSAAIGRNLDRNTGVIGETIAAQSDYTVTGFFAQTQWVVSPSFELLLGMRFDDVSTDRKPSYNADFQNNFVSQDGRGNFNNSNTIDGTSQVSPRIGFRLEIDESTNSILRGGFGLFQGKVPGVYLSNAFSRNGVTTGSISYDDNITLQEYLNNEFNPQDPILYQATPSGANIDLVDPNFELPSIWRTNVAYERDLPWYDLRFSVEAVYSRTNKGVYVEDLNLQQVATSPDGRALYAGTRSSGRFDSNYGSVFNLRNTEKGDALNVSFQVERPMIDNWSASAAYVYGESSDVSSVTSSTAFSNYANRAIFNGNEDVVATSNYEIKHRFMVRGTYKHEWSARTNTLVSLVYEGRSGRPYSWVFSDDFNNDGIRENDLFYVPSGPNDPKVDFSANSQAEIDAFFAFINSTSLAGYKGGTPARNSESSSFIHRFDIKLTQEIKLTGSTSLDLFLNLINVGNMINDDWGLTSEVPFGFVREVVEGEVNNAGLIEYDLGDSPASEEIQANRSRWQVQVGASFKF